ncbi:DeoR/GlpR family DNA-binding transcription regulator [Naasia lichenicola]|uniref:DeoR/GlpR transcriptional regulator n=1 Tax=Naasia lichenicola TaxID=2565933 RepID=A0A4S4FHP2_9MICO|nr:DeoR/GlpR family DNA-binding transcription regulator [Naasia lichenicola]THG29332.1 DeoR/GlpR transcriptional regulator [Naasia lichenicola]
MTEQNSPSDRYEGLRSEVILGELRAAGRVSVRGLSDRLGVSEVTIRKDLDALEDLSLLRRVRGGAVNSARGEEGAFADRLSLDSAVKRALAREVGRLVKDGDSIAIDSSTSGYYVAQELLDRRDLVVVTFGLRAAMLLFEQSDATVIMPGGVIRRQSGGMIGSFGDALAGRVDVRLGFFGTAAVSSQHGMLELSSEEAVTKRALVTASSEVHVLFASTKIDKFGLHSFASSQEVTRLYTDDGAPDDFVSDWEAMGTPVTRVPGTREGLSVRPAASRRVHRG